MQVFPEKVSGFPADRSNGGVRPPHAGGVLRTHPARGCPMIHDDKNDAPTHPTPILKRLRRWIARRPAPPGRAPGGDATRMEVGYEAAYTVAVAPEPADDPSVRQEAAAGAAPEPRAVPPMAAPSTPKRSAASMFASFTVRSRA